jgi:hypothetical protein
MTRSAGILPAKGRTRCPRSAFYYTLIIIKEFSNAPLTPVS